MSYELIQHGLSIAATTLQAAAALVTLYGFFTTAMKRKSHPAQLDLFAPVQLVIPPVVPTVTPTPDPVVPTVEPASAPVVPTLPDPWETESKLPVYLLPPLPLHPPTPHLLLLPPAREVAPVPKAKRSRKPKAVEPPTTALPTTVRELRVLCTQRGHKGAARWNKAKCLEALSA